MGKTPNYRQMQGERLRVHDTRISDLLLKPCHKKQETLQDFISSFASRRVRKVRSVHGGKIFSSAKSAKLFVFSACLCAFAREHSFGLRAWPVLVAIPSIQSLRKNAVPWQWGKRSTSMGKKGVVAEKGALRVSVNQD